MPCFKIGNRFVGEGNPVYFIADIGANHDGSLERAYELIRLAKQAGADAAKFQHFRAPKIVSGRGFEKLGKQLSHHARWHKPVYEVYEDASLPWEWTPDLKACCEEQGIAFLSTPYDFEAVNLLDAYVEAFKIGSGDITWIEMLEAVSRKRRPVILSTGASEIGEVQRAAEVIRAIHPEIAVLQCNTNYQGGPQSFEHVHLNVLRSYCILFPDAVLGLSDHTPGHASVLGAVALGARIIEKHFTDDNSRKGPDHSFAMSPDAWREMVDRTRELERALGLSRKAIAENERETVVVQRRCLRAARDLRAGTRPERSDIDVLRPAPVGAIPPFEIGKVIGRTLRKTVLRGDCLAWEDFESRQSERQTVFDPIHREFPSPQLQLESEHKEKSIC